MDNQNKNLEFHSTDIKPKPTTEFFTKPVKKSPIKDFFAKLDKKPFLRGWRKFAVFAGGLVIIAALIATPIIIYHIANQPTPKTTEELYADRILIANDTYRAAAAASQTDSDTSFLDALAVFDDAILQYDDVTVQNEIKYKKAKFLSLSQSYDDIIDILLELKADDRLEGDQRSKVYIHLITTYRANGNVTESAIIQEEYNALYPNETE